MDGVTAGVLLTLKGYQEQESTQQLLHVNISGPLWPGVLGLGHILLRPWEVVSNIHRTQLGKKEDIKNTTCCNQKSPGHSEG